MVTSGGGVKVGTARGASATPPTPPTTTGRDARRAGTEQGGVRPRDGERTRVAPCAQREGNSSKRKWVPLAGRLGVSTFFAGGPSDQTKRHV